jgi:inorganic pyrophosphatase
MSSSFTDLPALAEEGTINVIIETPKGKRNKYKFDQEKGIFTLGSVLPAGAVFPFDFGYVPSTLGEDGDPLDVLVLMDEPAFVGCHLQVRLIGVVEAEQTEKGKTERNDRLIAVAAESRDHQDVQTLEDVSDPILEEIEHFFISYNDIKGKEFKPKGRSGPKQALKLIEQGIEKAKKD